MRLKLLVLTLLIAAGLVVSSSASAAWSTYFGPALMNSSNYVQHTGWNYWTNNRVYRNTGHPFVLAWEQTYIHYSTENTGDNPFYYPSYGYNRSYCEWAYWHDLSGYVSPVTCQAYA